MMTKEEKDEFKSLFSKYCRQELNAGRCSDDYCTFCPIDSAYNDIFKPTDDECDNDESDDDEFDDGIVSCRFISIWEGYGEVVSKAKYDMYCDVVFDVEFVDLSEEELNECETLIGEFAEINGKRYDLEDAGNNEYHVIRC